jgi:hypothetical protein
MAYNTTNLLLRAWNTVSDLFNHTELVNNWEKIDAHDHNPIASGGNGGVPIPEGGIGVGAISNGKIQDGAVNARTLAANAVTDAILSSDSTLDANRAVGTNHIKNGAVTAQKLVVPAWQAVTYQTNWRTRDANVTYSVDVAKDGFGNCILRGVAERTTSAVSFGSSATDTVCTLPSAYRPLRTVYHRVACTDVNGAMGMARLLVQSDGTCRLDHAVGLSNTGGGLSGAAGFYAMFDGVVFATY